MLKNVAFCLVGGFLWTIPLQAETDTDNCPNLTSADDVLQCVLRQDKSLKISEADVGIAAAMVEEGSQRANPDLGIEVTKTANGYSKEFSLTQVFDLSGKRSSREQVAWAEKNVAESLVRKSKEEVAIRTVGQLFRLRQLEKEIELTQEGLATFQKVAQQFARAGALSPEQRISIAIFKMALEDHRIREVAMLAERRELIAILSTSLGRDFKPERKVLPFMMEKWPSLKKAAVQSADADLAGKEVVAAKAGYELEKSEAWPDLSLGPKVEIDENNKSWVGVSLSMPLPIYHQNQGQKGRAFAKLNRSEIVERKAVEESERYYAYLLEAYADLSTSIEKTLRESNVEAKHSDLHMMLKRGMVAAPLITELHRQRQEYYEQLHQQELKAINVLWQIYALEGRLEKEKIR